jgi:hypothetical protein
MCIYIYCFNLVAVLQEYSVKILGVRSLVELVHVQHAAVLASVELECLSCICVSSLAQKY